MMLSWAEVEATKKKKMMATIGRGNSGPGVDPIHLESLTHAPATARATEPRTPEPHRP